MQNLDPARLVIWALSLGISAILLSIAVLVIVSLVKGFFKGLKKGLRSQKQKREIDELIKDIKIN